MKKKSKRMIGVFETPAGTVTVALERGTEEHSVDASGPNGSMSWTIEAGSRAAFTSGLMSRAVDWYFKDTTGDSNE